MITYLFKNKKNLDNDILLERFITDYALEVINNTSKNVILGSSDMLVDIDKKYINILLFNDKINIKHTTDYIMEQLYG